MSSLSMVEARLPPGFRFHPGDDELVLDYLGRKLDGTAGIFNGPTLVDVDLNKCEPWDLPEVACIGGKEWYFFSRRDRKYATGHRKNRATESGYWKATGKDRLVSRRGILVGMRKTLVFYEGRAPKGQKTEWVMHEFRREGGGNAIKLPFKEDWVLCRVFYKSRYTVPRHEEDTPSTEAPSLPLPPLVDTFINFEQGMGSTVGYQQVPCFSSPISAPSYIPPGDFSTGLSCNSSRAVKEMLSQLTRFDDTSSIVKREFPSNQPQDGFESYLCENGLSNMWNPF